METKLANVPHISGLPSIYNAEDTGDVGFILGSGRSPGGRNGKPFQYSCLENPRKGNWRATVHRVAESQTQLITRTHHTHTCIHTCRDICTQTHVYVQTHVNIHIEHKTCMSTHTCMCAPAHTYRHAYTCRHTGDKCT